MRGMSRLCSGRDIADVECSVISAMDLCTCMISHHIPAEIRGKIRRKKLAHRLAITDISLYFNSISPILPDGRKMYLKSRQLRGVLKIACQIRQNFSKLFSRPF